MLANVPTNPTCSHGQHFDVPGGTCIWVVGKGPAQAQLHSSTSAWHAAAPAVPCGDAARWQHRCCASRAAASPLQARLVQHPMPPPHVQVGLTGQGPRCCTHHPPEPAGAQATGSAALRCITSLYCQLTMCGCRSAQFAGGAHGCCRGPLSPKRRARKLPHHGHASDNSRWCCGGEGTAIPGQSLHTEKHPQQLRMHHGWVCWSAPVGQWPLASDCQMIPEHYVASPTGLSCTSPRPTPANRSGKHRFAGMGLTGRAAAPPAGPMPPNTYPRQQAPSAQLGTTACTRHTSRGVSECTTHMTKRRSNVGTNPTGYTTRAGSSRAQEDDSHVLPQAAPPHHRAAPPQQLGSSHGGPYVYNKQCSATRPVHLLSSTGRPSRHQPRL